MKRYISPEVKTFDFELHLPFLGMSDIVKESADPEYDILSKDREETNKEDLWEEHISDYHW